MSRPAAGIALNPGRLAAGRVLLAIERGGHAEDLLAELAPPEGPDRRLAWHLALAVLRRRGALDHAIAAVAGRPVAAIDPPALAALRVGLAELHLGRTARHAAVDQAVELCRALGGRRATGFVNAVLRRAGGQPLPADPRVDLPPWLAQRWGPGFDAWIGRLGSAPPICGVWRDPACPEPALAVRPAEAAGAPIPGAFALVEQPGPVDALPGFAEGTWWVMDPAAVTVADLAAAEPAAAELAAVELAAVDLAAVEPPGAEPPGAGPWRVLDACAAPGGKSLRLAAGGAQVTAVDLVPARLARVEEGARRTGLPVQTVAHDWLEGPCPALGQFDAVLVDAPCTGLGTIRRHPEIRWRRQPTDPAAMALRQRRILAAAAQHVAPGGRLVYAVCSPMEEEGPAVAEALAGWTVTRRWSSSPPQGDEDAFQAFVLERAAAGDEGSR